MPVKSKTATRPVQVVRQSGTAKTVVPQPLIRKTHSASPKVVRAARPKNPAVAVRTAKKPNTK